MALASLRQRHRNELDAQPPGDSGRKEVDAQLPGDFGTFKNVLFWLEHGFRVS